MSTDLAEHQDAIFLANAMVACRLVDGPPTSPESRVVQLANALATDDDGLSSYPVLCGALAEVAVEVIRTGQRSGFAITNLDEFLASPYVLPEITTSRSVQWMPP
jgi:hypothetical protein